MSAPAALALTEHGYAVVPLVPATKRPAVGWRNRTGPATRRALDAWFRDDRRGVGVLTGAPSGGLAVLDFDGDAAERWAAGAALPQAPEVRTARGRHLWYRTPPGVALPSGTAILGVDGLDVRAAGGYVVAPDSLHPSGRPYEWTQTPWDRPPPPLPEPLLADLLRPSWHRDRADVLSLLDGVEEGRRNDAAARVVGHFLARGLAGDALRADMAAWNRLNRPPLPRRELEGVVRSIERREARKGAESREHLRPALEAAWAERPRWGARAGTDCDVYAAHLRIAWRAGRLTWHASVRDLAIEAWTTRKSAWVATDRLCAAGLLERVRPAEGARPACWRATCDTRARFGADWRKSARASVFALPAAASWAVSHTPSDPPGGDPQWNWESGPKRTEEEAMTGDERGGLSALNRMGKASAVALSLALGCTVHAATRLLRALEALGLAEETPEGWRTAEGDTRALEARRAAREAERARQAQAFAEERQAWRERVARSERGGGQRGPA